MKKQSLPVLTEHQEAVTLARYLDVLQLTGKIFLYSHVPNETFTKYWSVKTKNKQEGVHIGVPDYIIVTSGKVLFIELKRTKGSVTSDEQINWLTALEGKEIVTYLAHGADDAIKFVEEQL